MSSGEGTPGRRLRLVPARRAAAPAGPPRVEALDALLREVDDLRLTLETDLSLAASAVEAGEHGVAADILGTDRVVLHAFEERALEHLTELDSPRRQRVWAQVHAAPIVAAAALVGVLVGVVPQTLGNSADPSGRNVAATDSLERLQELAENGSTDQVRAASAQLHRQLAGVVANAEQDPAAAQTALLLLSYEQSAIERSGDSRALADVLRQSQALAAAIVAALPPGSRPSGSRLTLDLVEPTSSPAPKPSPSATASPKPKPTATATATSTPSPSASATSDKGPYPLPSTPVAP